MEEINNLAPQDIKGDVGRNVIIIYSDSGVVRARLSAPTFTKVTNTEKPYTEMPEGLHLEFFSGDLDTESELTANYGIIYDDESEMLARDNVKMNNIKGEQMEGEELIWNETEKKIYSDKFVKVTTAEEIIYGDGFEADQDFTSYQVKNIKGIIQINENEGL